MIKNTRVRKEYLSDSIRKYFYGKPSRLQFRTANTQQQSIL